LMGSYGWVGALAPSDSPQYASTSQQDADVIGAEAATNQAAKATDLTSVSQDAAAAATFAGASQSQPDALGSTARQEVFAAENTPISEDGTAVNFAIIIAGGFEGDAGKAAAEDLEKTVAGDIGDAAEGGAATAVSDETGVALGAAAGRAQAIVGEGSGPVYGTYVHTAFEAQIDALGQSDLYTEVSYKAGEIVPNGTSGSVRLDVVKGPSPAKPDAIYDLKTGSASLTPSRVAQIRSNLPPGSQNIPVIEVRP
jgi:hypothetical protein